MKRFILTEEEKSSILSLYVRKGLITEQDDGRFNQNVSSFEDDRFNFFIDNSRASKTINYYKSQYYNKTLEDKSRVDKILSEESKSLWDQLYTTAISPEPEATDPKFKEIVNIKIFVGNVIYYVISHDWVESVSVNDMPVVGGGGGGGGSTREGYEIKWDANQSTSNFYDNNKWELNAAGKNNIYQNVIKPVIDKKGTAKEACIDFVKVLSSASRYRNTDATGKPSDISFEQLSKMRNDSMVKYIIDTLKSSGIEQWCNTDNNIIQEYKGQNGDGTSGPNPPGPTPFVKKGGVKMSEVGTDNQRNEFGAAHSTSQEYEKYKYAIPTIQVAYKDKVVEEKPKPLTKYYAIFRGNVGVIKTPGGGDSSKGKTTTLKAPKVKVDPKLIQCTKF
jgi:hypothetical protein